MVTAIYVWFYATPLFNVVFVNYASENAKRRLGIWVIINLALAGTAMGVYLFTQTSGDG